MLHKALYSIISVFMLSLPVCTFASYGQTDNWSVEGLHGEMTISATLMDSPCSLAPESAEQEINMGHIARSVFTAPGLLSKTVPLHLVLENCMPGSRSVRDTGHGDNIFWAPEESVVRMTVIGEAEPTDVRLFRVEGDVSGVALRLENAAHEQLNPGEQSRPQILNPGRNDLVLGAQLSRTSEPLSSGQFQATVYIGLEYN